MEHLCYLCDPANPHRVVSYDKDTISFRFPKRFVGPPGRAHGGMSVASLMCPALRVASESGVAHAIVRKVSGRLHMPVPLNHTMSADVTVADEGYRVAVAADDATAVSGTVEIGSRRVGIGDMIQEVPESLLAPLTEALRLADIDLSGPTLQDRFFENCKVAGYHPGRNVCFGCSETPEALQLFNRMTPDGSLWTRWRTESAFVDSPSQLAFSITAASLDCSNLWILNKDDVERRLPGGKFFITGSFSVHFLRVPPIKMPNDYRVVAQHLRTEGRKGHTMSVLLDDTGVVYAIAESTAILIDTPEELILKKLEDACHK